MKNRIGPVPVTHFPLTFTQRDIYLDIERHTASTPHSLAVSVRLDASLNAELWLLAVRRVIGADPTTRLRFAAATSEGGQWLDEHPAETLACVNDLPSIIAPYDLTHGPLVRHALHRLDDGNYQAILGMPHLLADGHTFRLLFERVSQHYEALIAKQDAPSEQPPSFVDYLAGAVPSLPADLAAFWKARLENVAPLIFTPPTDLRGTFEEVSLSLPDPAVSDIRRYCTDSGLSVSVFFLALSALVFQSFRERNGDWIVHAIKGSRPRAFRDTLGCFFHVVPYLFGDRHFAPDQPLATLFHYVTAYRRELAQYQTCPMFEQQKLIPPGGSRLIYNYYDFDQAQVLGRRRPLTVHMTHTPAETHVILSDRVDGMDLRLRFHTSTFNDRTVPRRLAHMAQQIIQGATALKEVDWLLPEERSLWLSSEAAPAEAGITPVHRLFEQHAIQAPERIALTDGDLCWTYAQLNAWADDIAGTLQNQLMEPETRVGLFLDRSALQVASILGVLKAGGAYVPIDPEYPAERIRFIWKTAGCLWSSPRSPW